MLQNYIVFTEIDIETYNGIKIRARQVDSEVSH